MSIILPLASLSNWRRLRHISFLTLSLLLCSMGSEFVCSEESPGYLRPHHLPPPTIFTDFDRNTTVNLPNGTTYSVAVGRLKDANNLNEFTVMENAVDRTALDQVLGILHSYDKYNVLNVDPDSIDGMTSYEIYINNDDMNDDMSLDSDPKEYSSNRALVRRKIRSILDPYLNNVLTPYLNQKYASACEREGRRCRPCNSLIRRYRHGERQGIITHHDTTIATIVVSLSDYGIDYTGGLYVSMNNGKREYLGLNKGDAVIHQSSLLHGVKVYDLEDEPEKTERWSWVLWYLDSDTCDDYSEEWFADCAAEGDPLCQQLHAENLETSDRAEEKEVGNQIVTMHQEAAKGGSTISAVQMAHAYMGRLFLPVPLDYDKAKEYYEMAIQYNCPVAHYGMAELILELLSGDETGFQTTLHDRKEYKQEMLTKVAYHLEASARMDYIYAMFNLGMVHKYGYGVPQINTTLAAEWFAASGLPEGYYLSSQQARSVNDKERERAHLERARKLGFVVNSKKKEIRTDDLNLMWPSANNGSRPPTFYEL